MKKRNPSDMCGGYAGSGSISSHPQLRDRGMCSILKSKEVQSFGYNLSEGRPQRKVLLDLSRISLELRLPRLQITRIAEVDEAGPEEGMTGSICLPSLGQSLELSLMERRIPRLYRLGLATTKPPLVERVNLIRGLSDRHLPQTGRERLGASKEERLA